MTIIRKEDKYIMLINGEIQYITDYSTVHRRWISRWWYHNHIAEILFETGLSLCGSSVGDVNVNNTCLLRDSPSIRYRQGKKFNEKQCPRSSINPWTLSHVLADTGQDRHRVLAVSRIVCCCLGWIGGSLLDDRMSVSSKRREMP